jgi:hypothetical protein
MQQPAIFCCEQENQAIDDPQKLLEIVTSAKCALAECLTESSIGRVLDKTLTLFRRYMIDA